VRFLQRGDGAELAESAIGDRTAPL
jgi:hypothetical protein